MKQLETLLAKAHKLKQQATQAKDEAPASVESSTGASATAAGIDATGSADGEEGSDPLDLASGGAEMAVPASPSSLVHSQSLDDKPVARKDPV